VDEAYKAPPRFVALLDAKVEPKQVMVPSMYKAPPMADSLSQNSEKDNSRAENGLA